MVKLLSVNTLICCCATHFNYRRISLRVNKALDVRCSIIFYLQSVRGVVWMGRYRSGRGSFYGGFAAAVDQ